jgi:hypothetical protein
MGWDLAILESGNGGDVSMNGNDLAVFYADENDIYLRMFGGNIEEDTRVNRLPSERDKSFWGNKLLFNNDPAISFNSLTERTLNNTPLTSAGRALIESAIKKDLSGLNTAVTVQIVSTDRIDVTIKNTLAPGSEPIKKFSFTRNPITGDFDFNDFSNLDFF